MKEVTQKVTLKENESRKSYLLRVVIQMLKENAYSMNSIIYDEAQCDALCLIGDLKAEFNIK